MERLKPGDLVILGWSDFFIEQTDAWREEAWEVIRKTSHLNQVLTKRAQRIKDYFPSDWGNGLPNVRLGGSVENADYLWGVESLLEIPASARFMSYEPALGRGDFIPYFPVIQWVISGGESVSIRYANMEWFREVRDSCIKTDVSYFHKQNGGNRKIEGD